MTTADDSPAADAHGRVSGWLSRALTRALTGLQLEQPCDTCGGDGTLVETRECQYDDLTDTQREFLYEAQFERRKAEMGGESDSSSIAHSQSQQVPKPSSMGSSRPPIR